MKTGAIIQARMSSRRLPGKVLKVVSGKPLLQYLIERLDHCEGINKIVVATSDDESDKPIIDHCKKKKISYYRGSLENVASRFYAALKEFEFDIFARVNADSPLLDQRLIQKGLDLILSEKSDLVTNVWPRTYPAGQSVEVLKSEIYQKTFARMKDAEDLEHVTKYFYRNHQKFKMTNFISETDYSDLKMSVDTRDDLEIFASIIGKMTRPHWEYDLDGLVSLYREVTAYH